MCLFLYPLYYCPCMASWFSNVFTWFGGFLRSRFLNLSCDSWRSVESWFINFLDCSWRSVKSCFKSVLHDSLRLRFLNNLHDSWRVVKLLFLNLLHDSRRSVKLWFSNLLHVSCFVKSWFWTFYMTPEGTRWNHKNINYNCEAMNLHSDSSWFLSLIHTLFELECVLYEV